MKIIWAEEAFSAWKDTIDYIVQEFGPHAAEKFYKKTEECQDMLISSPLMGKVEPLLKGRSHAYRSLIVQKRSKLVYYTQGDTIFIVDFWDVRREPKQQAERLT